MSKTHTMIQNLIQTFIININSNRTHSKEQFRNVVAAYKRIVA